MAAYTDYTFYTGTYLGSVIASADFPALALKASAYLDKISYGRVAVVVAAATDTATIAQIKMAVCAIAEVIKTDGDAITGNAIDGIQSENVGSSSVTYNPQSSAQDSFSMKITQAAELYIDTASGLLFKGFAEGEYADQYRHHNI